MNRQTANFCSQISAMNNMAVAHLLDERTDECLGLLQCALQHVRTALQDVAVAKADHYKVAATKRSRIRHRNGSFFQSVPMNVESSSKIHSNNEGGTFAFFDRLLTFSQDTISENTCASKECHDSPEKQAVEQLLVHQNHLLVTLFFNMAVCHHAKGMLQCQSIDLATALKLYELAFSIIDTTQSSDFGWGDQQMILLAIYNNMGHIHATFCSTQETQLCVDFVKRIFLAQPSSQYYQQQPQKENPCTLEPYDYQFFVQYVPVNAQAQCNIAPAA